jgi:cysteine synthase A
MRRAVRSITELIGNTPMVKLNRIVPKGSADVYAKLEVFNPGGSIKDRIALNMIEQAEKNGLVKAGSRIVEATSGNTGIGLAMVGAARGYHVTLVMPDNMSFERLQILKSFGAEVVLTPVDEGMSGAVEKAKLLVRESHGAFMPSQFSNPDNPAAHRKATGKEILADMDGRIDAFVAGVGTGGTITGVGEVLKKHDANIKVFGVEPASSPVLSGGKPGAHMIQGIGAGFVPQVLNRAVIDEIFCCSDEDAYQTASRLCKLEGIFAGISCGAACWGALKAAERLGPGKTVVVIFPDSGERYLSMVQYFEG